VREIGIENRDGIQVHDISYASPKGGRVTAYYRYVNANTETAKRAAAALDGFNAAVEISDNVELVN
jgi:hypothetical protein